MVGLRWQHAPMQRPNQTKRHARQKSDIILWWALYLCSDRPKMGSPKTVEYSDKGLCILFSGYYISTKCSGKQSLTYKMLIGLNKIHKPFLINIGNLDSVWDFWYLCGVRAVYGNEPTVSTLVGFSGESGQSFNKSYGQYSITAVVSRKRHYGSRILRFDRV